MMPIVPVVSPDARSGPLRDSLPGHIVKNIARNALALIRANTQCR